MSQGEGPSGRGKRWILDLLVVAAAICLVVAIRRPLVLNASVHLDSDLAVDGLTLLDATRGQFRWHYPGTPSIGALPVLFSLPEALISGATPEALVRGGVLVAAFVAAAAYAMMRTVFGFRAAVFGLVPLVFSSTGLIWLSGRITGGHLLIVGWYALALAGLAACFRGGGRGRVIGLGVWCGLGIFVDSMFVVALAGMIPGAVIGWLMGERRPKGWVAVPVFLLGLVIGLVPAVAGRILDPYDAYQDTFAASTDPKVLLEHARILTLECLPRLVAGHKLPGLESEPDPSAIGDASGRSLSDLGRARKSGLDPLAALVTGVGLLLFVGSIVGLARPPGKVATSDPGRTAVVWSMLFAFVAVAAGFVLNRNIFNSDNYRYLVLWCLPWSAGFGVWLDRMSRGRGGLATAVAIAVGLSGLMVVDTMRWYRGLGWNDPATGSVARKVEDPLLDWINAHPEVDAIQGGYWDVYRLSFLTGGKVQGVPHPVFPNRFPERSNALPGGRPRWLVIRPTQDGAIFREKALAEGGKVVHQGRGFVVIDWPTTGQVESKNER